eukprot:9466755-Pyramimonas_sp.AAC.2
MPFRVKPQGSPKSPTCRRNGSTLGSTFCEESRHRARNTISALLSALDSLLIPAFGGVPSQLAGVAMCR